MSALSPRLAAVVAAVPLRPGARVLEVGCGPGAAARALADRPGAGFVLGIDRSAKAIAAAVAGAGDRPRLAFRTVAIEDFELLPGEEPFDLVLAVRVGALDGRHPAAGALALHRIAAATTPDARLLVDGGDPLRELPIPRTP